jgi:hypothetical protein
MNYDLCIIGGGSGGTAAAIAAGRYGLKTLLVEAADCLGGTAVRAGVSIWEMGCGGTGIPFDLYRRLQAIPGAVGIYRINRHCCWPEDGFYPGGESVLDPSLTYQDTLCRHSQGALSFGCSEDKPLIRARWHGVVNEPEALSRVMLEACQETGRVTVRLGVKLDRVETEAGKVLALWLSDGTRVTATTFIDGTGDGVLCGACGCERHLGRDPRSRYDEPGAPETADHQINGVSLIFRITPKSAPGIDVPPIPVPETCWWRRDFPIASCVQYPNGDYNINILPTLEGHDYLRLGPEAAYPECLRRIYAFWRYWQDRFPEWQAYRIGWIAPALGVRESYRVVSEYMLTRQDAEVGLARQTHPDLIAVNDHPLDVHGGGGDGTNGVTSAYGVPFRCLIPKGWKNLLVASRAAGMSSQAASSCRLTRVIMALGQAAGTAAAWAMETGRDVARVDPTVLRRRLREQGATWVPEDVANATEN